MSRRRPVRQRPGERLVPRAARRSDDWLDTRTGAQPDRAALERSPLVLAHATPDAGVLAGVDGPAEALVKYLAPAADLLGLFDLKKRGPAVSDREKQLWIYLTTGGDVAPVHGVPFLA